MSASRGDRQLPSMPDTLTLSHRFEASGFSREQADGLAQLFGRHPVADLRRNFRTLHYMTAIAVVFTSALLCQLIAVRVEVEALLELLNRQAERPAAQGQASPRP
jgi:hypothetical protein